MNEKAISSSQNDIISCRNRLLIPNILKHTFLVANVDLFACSPYMTTQNGPQGLQSDGTGRATCVEGFGILTC